MRHVHHHVRRVERVATDGPGAGGGWHRLLVRHLVPDLQHRLLQAVDRHLHLHRVAVLRQLQLLLRIQLVGVHLHLLLCLQLRRHWVQRQQRGGQLHAVRHSGRHLRHQPRLLGRRGHVLLELPIWRVWHAAVPHLLQCQRRVERVGYRMLHVQPAGGRQRVYAVRVLGGGHVQLVLQTRLLGVARLAHLLFYHGRLERLRNCVQCVQSAGARVRRHPHADDVRHVVVHVCCGVLRQRHFPHLLFCVRRLFQRAAHLLRLRRRVLLHGWLGARAVPGRHVRGPSGYHAHLVCLQRQLPGWLLLPRRLHQPAAVCLWRRGPVLPGWRGGAHLRHQRLLHHARVLAAHAAHGLRGV